MSNPQQSSSRANSHSPQLKNKRRLWIILGSVIIALIILLVVCAAFAVLLGFMTIDNPGIVWGIGLVSMVLLFVGSSLVVVLISVIVLKAVRRKIQAAQDWPATRGLVLTSEVRDGGPDSGWYAKIIYRYEVGGRVYENSRIAVAVEYGDHSFQANERLAARFPVGAQVSVYYDPQNPADSALIKGDPNSSSPSLFLCW